MEAVWFQLFRGQTQKKSGAKTCLYFLLKFLGNKYWMQLTRRNILCSFLCQKTHYAPQQAPSGAVSAVPAPLENALLGEKKKSLWTGGKWTFGASMSIQTAKRFVFALKLQNREGQKRLEAGPGAFSLG